MSTGRRLARQVGILALGTITISLVPGLVFAGDPFAPPGTSLVRVPIPDRDQMRKLHALGLQPEEADREHVSFRVTAPELEAMQALGLAPQPWDGPLADIPSGDREVMFTSYSQMVAELTQTVADHPSIAELVSIGSSVQGREILAIKITDNPSVEEFEPEVRICGAHHGNERMSAEMCLNLIQHLTDNYGLIPSIASLVNGREIWVIPMVNPDGVEAGSRYNSHGVDLNRNYGYMWESGGGSAYFSEPETRAIRDNATDNWFNLSLSFHCSGDVVNSVWNYTPIYTEDDDVVWELTEGYATYNGYWAVRGWYWYETHGDCNDWSYGARSDIDWTIEVASSNETAVWNANRDAILYIIDAAGRGLHGRVTDAATGDPLRARVSIQGRDWSVFTDPALGDYHRVLLPGTYTVRIEANGYQTLVVPNVIVPAPGGAATLDVQMTPGGGHYADRIEIANVADPSNVYANHTLTMAMLGAPDGVGCSIGRTGQAVVDLGPGSIVTNTPGYDLRVHEASPDALVEGYQLYGGSSYMGPWTLIGTGSGTTAFDLAGSGLASARYLRIVDDGDGNYNDPYAGVDIDGIEVLASTIGTPDIALGPTATAMQALRPNPALAGRAVDIAFDVPAGARYRLDVLDVAGSLVRTIAEGTAHHGRYSSSWDGTDSRGARSAPGVYFVRLRAAGQSAARRIVLVR